MRLVLLCTCTNVCVLRILLGITYVCKAVHQNVLSMFVVHQLVRDQVGEQLPIQEHKERNEDGNVVEGMESILLFT